MFIEKRHKPTFHKANARYRGVTELGQYSNFILESAHDIVHLNHLISGNEKKGVVGQLNEIENNFRAITSGDREVAKSNVFTASTLNKVGEAIDIPALENWSPLNKCAIVKTDTSVILESKGLVDPVGIHTPLYVQPGQLIYIRLKVKSATGAPTFTIGSSDIRTGPTESGILKTFSIPKNNDYLLIDFVLPCKYSETINLAINIHQTPDELKAESVEIKDFEIHYLESRDVSVKSYREEIKPMLNAMNKQLYSIK